MVSSPSNESMTRRTPGFLGAHEESRALIHAAVEEGVAAAHACGVAVDGAKIHALTQVSVTDHADHEAAIKELADTVSEVSDDRGVMLVPAFAIGRTQELIWVLDELVRDGHLQIVSRGEGRKGTTYRRA